MAANSMSVLGATGLLLVLAATLRVRAQPAEPARAQPAEPARAQPAEPARAQPAEPARAQLAEPARAQPAEPAAASSEAIVITATRSARRLADVPVATEVIGRAEIERMGARNAADALGTRAGIDVVRSLGASGVRLQGLDSAYVLVLVDGLRVSGRLDGAIDMKRFAAEDIERIEIVRGAGSALYGSDAIGGVINIITRAPRAPLFAEVRASYGTLNQLDLSASAATRQNRGSGRAAAGFQRGDAYDWRPSDPATNGSTFDEAHASLGGEITLGKHFEMRSDASYRARNQHAIDQGAGGAVFDREQHNQELNLSLQPRWLFHAGDQLGLTVHYTQVIDRLLLDQRLSDALDQSETTHDRLLEAIAQLDALAWQHHSLTGGIEGSQEWLASPRITDSRAARSRIAAYVQDEFKVLSEPAFTLVPGARVDVDSQFGAHATPKLTARLDPREDLVLRASYGFGFRAPTFKEQFLRFENLGVGYVILGNPDLQPETSRSVNLGAEYQPLAWLWGTLELYRTDLSGMISPESVSSGSEPGAQLYRYVNIATAHSQGFDVRARVRSDGGFGVELEYALTDARDDTQQRAIEGMAMHRASLQLGYSLRAWSLDASAAALLVGRRPFYRDDDGDGVEESLHAKPYASIRLRVAKDFGSWLTLFLGVENLLDAGDADWLPIPPRSFYGGLSARI